jgi:serine/threonine protein kinase
MLTARGHLKVLDFGVAKMTIDVESTGHDDWSVEPRTAVGSVIGSGPYMSPEQIGGGHVDPRSDVFSLGVVLYEMATGQLPFSSATREEMMHSILHAAPEPMTRLNRDIPPDLERIALKCLEKNPATRYQSARELLSDLWPLKRRAAALRALALDDRSADAQVALGQVMFFSEWDWIASERSFQRALAINPNHAEAYLHYGSLMEALGDLPRGLELKLRGLECDPRVSARTRAHCRLILEPAPVRRRGDMGEQGARSRSAASIRA